MKKAVVYVKKPSAASKALQEVRRTLLPIIVSSAVHELNQPLTMLNIVSDTLRLLAEQQTTTTEELGELAAETASGAKRFQSIVEQLRELSLNDEQTKHININEAVSECVRLVASKMRGLGCQIKLMLKATAPIVLCSSVKLSYLIFGALFYVCDMPNSENRRPPKHKILFSSARTTNEIVLSCYSVSRLKKALSLSAKDKVKPLRLVQSLAKELGGRASIVLNKKKQPILEMRLPLHKPSPE